MVPSDLQNRYLYVTLRFDRNSLPNMALNVFLKFIIPGECFATILNSTFERPKSGVYEGVTMEISSCLKHSTTH